MPLEMNKSQEWISQEWTKNLPTLWETRNFLHRNIGDEEIPGVDHESADAVDLPGVHVEDVRNCLAPPQDVRNYLAPPQHVKTDD